MVDENILNISLRFRKHRCFCLQLFLVVLLCFLPGCLDESYIDRELESSFTLDTTGMTLEQIYDEVAPMCADYLAGHVLTQINGEFSIGDNKVHFGKIVFVFYQYIDDTAEGGKISVISVSVDGSTTKTVRVSEFLGAGKASNVSGVELLSNPLTLQLAENIILQEENTSSNNTNFEIWRSITNMQEDDGKGAPSVRLYQKAI